jgi:hypothetical protein
MELHGNTEKFNADIQELRARIAEKAKGKRRALAAVSSLWWKVAAVLLTVVTGVAIIIFTGQHKNAQHEIAKTENKRDNDEATKREEPVNTQGVVESEKIKENDTGAGIKKDISSKPKELKKAPVAKVYEPANVNKADSKNITESAASVSDSVSVAVQAPRAEAQDQEKVSRQLEGRAAGVDVRRAEEDDSMFDEVVVVGFGQNAANNARSKAVSAGSAEKRVIPGNGWDAFQRYIKDSANINSADSVFSGEEQLSFTIGDDGLPESIKILRSISPSHDRESIRLLQNGPSWRVTKGRKREVRLKIIF